MARDFSTADLEAYLDESLSASRVADVEAALRNEPALVDQLATIAGRRDAGVHSIGAIWRRERLSCPTRETTRQLPARHTRPRPRGVH